MNKTTCTDTIQTFRGLNNHEKQFLVEGDFKYVFVIVLSVCVGVILKKKIHKQLCKLHQPASLNIVTNGLLLPTLYRMNNTRAFFDHSTCGHCQTFSQRLKII